uniref:Uncharacterized protein n=1 Tax=Ciona savignyi TaxID=51511 RepID=H2ZPN7_CIOSA
MTVTHIYTADQTIAEVSGVGYNDNGDVTVYDQVVTPKSHPLIAAVAEIGAICNNAQIEDEVLLGQPTEGAMIALAMKMGLGRV